MTRRVQNPERRPNDRATWAAQQVFSSFGRSALASFTCKDIILFIYLFLAARSLRCCTGFSPAAASRGCSLVAPISHCSGLSCGRAQAEGHRPGSQAHDTVPLQHTGSPRTRDRTRPPMVAGRLPLSHQQRKSWTDGEGLKTHSTSLDVSHSCTCRRQPNRIFHSQII